MQSKIPFNKPFVAGKELYYIAQAVALGNIAADGYFTKADGEVYFQLLENDWSISCRPCSVRYRVQLWRVRA